MWVVELHGIVFPEADRANVIGAWLFAKYFVTAARAGVHGYRGLTPWLTGAGARSAEGTDMGHENAEGMAHVGVRVEPPVRLGRVVEERCSCHGWLLGVL